MKSKDLGMKYKLWNEGAQSSRHEDLLNRPKIRELVYEIETGKVKHILSRITIDFQETTKRSSLSKMQ